MTSAAPTILQSMVLHPPATEARADGRFDETESLIPPAQSSGTMSGRLAPVGPTSVSATAYTRDPAVSSHVRQAFLRSVEQRRNGAVAAAIGRNLDQQDPLLRWSAMVRDAGLNTGDVADALASYWVLNWAMANGGATTAADMQAVRDQIRWAVISQPRLLRLTNGEKQAMAEEAMLNFIYELTGYLQARQAGNEKMLSRFAEGAELRFRREMAVDLQSLVLTRRGLEAKR